MKRWVKRILRGLAVASSPVELRANWEAVVLTAVLALAVLGFAWLVLSSPPRTRNLRRLIVAWRK